MSLIWIYTLSDSFFGTCVKEKQKTVSLFKDLRVWHHEHYFIDLTDILQEIKYCEGNSKVDPMLNYLSTTP
jgi:hypothetical protein